MCKFGSHATDLRLIRYSYFGTHATFPATREMSVSDQKYGAAWLLGCTAVTFDSVASLKRDHGPTLDRHVGEI